MAHVLCFPQLENPYIYRVDTTVSLGCICRILFYELFGEFPILSAIFALIFRITKVLLELALALNGKRSILNLKKTPPGDSITSCGVSGSGPAEWPDRALWLPDF